MLLRHKPQCPLKHSRYSINTNDHCHYVLGYLLILSITSVNFSLRVPPAQICSSLFIMSMRLTCSFSISVSQDPYIKKKNYSHNSLAEQASRRVSVLISEVRIINLRDTRKKEVERD